MERGPSTRGGNGDDGAAHGAHPHAGQDNGDDLKAQAQGVGLDAEKAGQDDLDGDEGRHQGQVAGCEDLLLSVCFWITLHRVFLLEMFP